MCSLSEFKKPFCIDSILAFLDNDLIENEETCKIRSDPNSGQSLHNKSAQSIESCNIRWDQKSGQSQSLHDKSAQSIESGNIRWDQKSGQSQSLHVQSAKSIGSCEIRWDQNNAIDLPEKSAESDKTSDVIVNIKFSPDEIESMKAAFKNLRSFDLIEFQRTCHTFAKELDAKFGGQGSIVYNSIYEKVRKYGWNERVNETSSHLTPKEKRRYGAISWIDFLLMSFDFKSAVQELGRLRSYHINQDDPDFGRKVDPLSYLESRYNALELPTQKWSENKEEIQKLIFKTYISTNRAGCFYCGAESKHLEDRNAICRSICLADLSRGKEYVKALHTLTKFRQEKILKDLGLNRGSTFISSVVNALNIFLPAQTTPLLITTEFKDYGFEDSRCNTCGGKSKSKYNIALHLTTHAHLAAQLYLEVIKWDHNERNIMQPWELIKNIIDESKLESRFSGKIMMRKRSWDSEFKGLPASCSLPNQPSAVTKKHKSSSISPITNASFSANNKLLIPNLPEIHNRSLESGNGYESCETYNNLNTFECGGSGSQAVISNEIGCYFDGRDDNHRNMKDSTEIGTSAIVSGCLGDVLEVASCRLSPDDGYRNQDITCKELANMRVLSEKVTNFDWLCHVCKSDTKVECSFQDVRMMKQESNKMVFAFSVLNNFNEESAHKAYPISQEHDMINPDTAMHMLFLLNPWYSKFMKSECEQFSSTIVKKTFRAGRYMCDDCEGEILNLHKFCATCGINLCLTCRMKSLGKCNQDREHHILTACFASPWRLLAMCPVLLPEANTIITSSNINHEIIGGLFLDCELHVKRVSAKESQNVKLFTQLLSSRSPFVYERVVSNDILHDWTPREMIKRFGNQRVNEISLENTKLSSKKNMSTFLRKFDTLQKKLVAIKDWPETLDFKTNFLESWDNLKQCLPIKEYTTKEGHFNLLSYLPYILQYLELGPKFYIALGTTSKFNLATTALHVDIADAINVLLHVGNDALCADDDQLETYLQTLNLDEATRSRCVTERNKIGAHWQIFSRQDFEKIEDILKKYAHEDKTQSIDDKSGQHFIHEKGISVTPFIRERLIENGICIYDVIQFEGDAVIIQSRSPHQVTNLRSCVKFAMDFISAETLNFTIQTAEELKSLLKNSTKKGDKIGVEKIVFHAYQRLYRMYYSGTKI